jgi:OOP family OmpA-OmpF porin
MRCRALLLSAFAFALLPRLAAAQTKASPSLDLRGFHASPDAASGLYYEPASSPGHLDANAAAWLSYAYSPLVLREADSGAIVSRPIEHSLTGDFAVNVGLFGRAALGLVLPYAVYQAGDTPDEAALRVLGDTRVAAQALGDLALVGKLTLIPPTSGDHGGLALALHERFTLPTGDETSFLGEGDVTSETRLLAEYTTRAFGVYGATGFKLRGGEERFGCAPGKGSTGEDACLTRFGHELPFGLSFRFLPRALGIDSAGRWTTFAEIFGQVPLSPIDPFNKNHVATVEAAVGVRVAFQRDFSLLAGVATAVVAGLGEPPFRGTIALGWAPRTHDADGDLIDDDIDQCRELAEDRDGFEDDDGCPEGDNDQDTVPDQADRCPNQKEDLDGFHDDDGCPDLDNDGDQIADDEDACPNEAGVASPSSKHNGCPLRDQDGDGILDDADLCPLVPEDKDSFQDGDGCPENDNDLDGVADSEDTCPNVPGVPSSDPKQRGCPEIDVDGDTFWGTEDKCPLEAEDFNGNEDGDGCPDDAKKKPLVVLKEGKDGPTFTLTKAVAFTKSGEIEAESVAILRAVGAELVKHPAAASKPAWSVAVGVRPSPKGGASEAMLRSFTVVDALRRFTKRDTIAETVGWAAVKDLPGAAAQGIGFLLLTGAAEGAPGAPSKTTDKVAPPPPAPGPTQPNPTPRKLIPLPLPIKLVPKTPPVPKK